jgi:hypothetical protein
MGQNQVFHSAQPNQHPFYFPHVAQLACCRGPATLPTPTHRVTRPDPELRRNPTRVKIPNPANKADDPADDASATHSRHRIAPPPHRATTPDLWTHAQAVGMKDFPGFNLGSYLTDFIPFVNSTENHRFEEPFGDRFGCGVLAPHDGSFPPYKSNPMTLLGASNSRCLLLCESLPSPSCSVAARPSPPGQEAPQRSPGAAPPLALDRIPPKQAITDCLEVEKMTIIVRATHRLSTPIKSEVRTPASTASIFTTCRRALYHVGRV